MKAETKKMIITIINIVIFIGNAIISQISGNVDVSVGATVSSAIVSTIACA